MGEYDHHNLITSQPSFFFPVHKIALGQNHEGESGLYQWSEIKKEVGVHDASFNLWWKRESFLHQMVRTDRTNQSKDKPIVVCGLWLTKLPSACSIYTTTHALNNTTTPSDIANPTSEKWKKEKKEKPLHVSEASNERRDRKGLGWVGVMGPHLAKLVLVWPPCTPRYNQVL